MDKINMSQVISELPKKAQDKKFPVYLNIREITEIIDDLCSIGSSCLDMINKIDRKEVEVPPEKLRYYKTMESNCRLLMNNLINQIPEDLAKKLNIKQHKHNKKK